MRLENTYIRFAQSYGVMVSGLSTRLPKRVIRVNMVSKHCLLNYSVKMIGKIQQLLLSGKYMSQVPNHWAFSLLYYFLFIIHGQLQDTET